MPAQRLYYKKDKDVADDTELQAWWEEIRTQGHADADPAGWPDNCKDGITTIADLANITTTMAWMGSAHHAAGAEIHCGVGVGTSIHGLATRMTPVHRLHECVVLQHTW